MCSSVGKRSYNTSFKRLIAMFLTPLTSRYIIKSQLEQLKTCYLQCVYHQILNHKYVLQKIKTYLSKYKASTPDYKNG